MMHSRIAYAEDEEKQDKGATVAKATA